MTVLDALFLGLLQGITELLPISSSGHLVLAEAWLGLKIPAELKSFDILLHSGSLLALLVCYPSLWWRILRSPFTGERTYRRLLLAIVLATIPAALAGIAFEEVFQETMRSPGYLAAGFLLTALVLILSDWLPERPSASVRWTEAFLIGLAQAAALPPSVSRSGMTIAAARALGWSRTMAVDFSFLLAVPVIGGATLVTALHLADGAPVPSLPVVFTGVLASFGASVFSILFLRLLVKRLGLQWFALYLIPLGLFLLAR